MVEISFNLFKISDLIILGVTLSQPQVGEITLKRYSRTLLFHDHSSSQVCVENESELSTGRLSVSVVTLNGTVLINQRSEAI